MVVYIGGKAYPDGTTITYTNPGGHGRDRWEEGSTSHANYWIIPAASPPDAATSFSSSSASSTSVSSTAVEIDLGYSLINICQPKFIWFECTGLRPNTPHWIFFNGVEVTNFVRTGIDRDTFDAYPKNDPIRNPGDRYLSATSYPSELGGPTAASGPLTSSTSGVIYGLFYLQSNETVNFPTGTNLLYALDVSAFRPENSLSLAKGSYTALAQYEYYYENSKPKAPSVAVSNPTYETSTPSTYGRADYDGGEPAQFGNFQGPNLDGSAGYTAEIGSDPGTGETKIVCTAMNKAYGFGSFRQKIWLAHSYNMPPEYQIGYHAIFLPWVRYVYNDATKNDRLARIVRNWLEGVAKRRTADIWAQSRGRKRKLSVIVERKVLESLCYVTGWIITKAGKTK